MIYGFQNQTYRNENNFQTQIGHKVEIGQSVWKFLDLGPTLTCTLMCVKSKEIKDEIQ